MIISFLEHEVSKLLGLACHQKNDFRFGYISANDVLKVLNGNLVLDSVRFLKHKVKVALYFKHVAVQNKIINI